MFEKLRVQLTAFLTLATGLILTAMTLVCLLISENGVRQQAQGAFADSQRTAAAYLEEQSAVSLTWIRQTERNSHLYLYILDSGVPLKSMSLSGEDHLALFEQARDYARTQYGLAAESFRGPRSLGAAFELRQEGERSFAGVTLISKGEGVLELVLVAPQDELEASIARQRIQFALADLAAIVLLALFAWNFTGKMLRPIRESREQQTRFIAAASHELRAPLTVMQSAVSALDRAGPEQQGQFTAMLRSEIGRMGRLVSDMLVLANADAQNWSLRLEETDLTMVLLSVYEKYEAPARKKGLDLSLRLPAGDCPRGRLDGERIEQLLTILLDNALSYTPAPGRVTLSLTCNGVYRLMVSDTGPGVPDGQKKEVFRRFHRADTAHHDRSHFGLGLAIAKELTELHGGKIWVEDAPEGGAAFLVELPLK